MSSSLIEEGVGSGQITSTTEQTGAQQYHNQQRIQDDTTTDTNMTSAESFPSEPEDPMCSDRGSQASSDDDSMDSPRQPRTPSDAFTAPFGNTTYNNPEHDIDMNGCTNPDTIVLETTIATTKPAQTPSSSPHFGAFDFDPSAPPLLSQRFPASRHGVRVKKLVRKLQSKFGADGFEVKLCQDVFTIRVPVRLESTELKDCC